jgi:hypothetical protein
MAEYPVKKRAPPQKGGRSVVDQMREEARDEKPMEF